MRPGRPRPRLLDLVLPPACLGCGGWMGTSSPSAPPRYLCPGCAARIRTPPRPVCRRCGAPVNCVESETDPGCAECSTWPPALRRAVFAALLEPPADDLVHALKYGGWPEAAKEMARSLVPPLRSLLDPGDTPRLLLVPVPTTRERMRRRGYNQAEALAHALAAALDAALAPRAAGGAVEVAHLLVRPGSAGSQVALHREERMANVHGAFVLNPEAPAGVGSRDRIILVDDVLTTGATASAAALALEEAGLGAVDLVTYGRAFPEREAGPGVRLPGPGYFFQRIRPRPTPAPGG